jgi:stage II sporulation protein D
MAQPGNAGDTTGRRARARTPARARGSRLALRSLRVTAATLGLIGVVTALPGGGAGTAPASADAGWTTSAGGLVVTGHGSGHGRGLSQWGAQARALAGQDAAQILSAYYPGTASAVVNGGRTIRVRLAAHAGAAVTLAPGDGGVLSVAGSSRGVGSGQRLTLTPVAGAVELVWRDGAGGVLARRTMRGQVRVRGTAGIWALGAGRSGTLYQGMLRMVPGAVSQLVDDVGLENYLRGVVPKEVPAGWRPAALQAQAVAARSYVLALLDTAAAPGAWDTCDTASCQVYGGLATGGPGVTPTPVATVATDAAVEATAGRYLTFGGHPAYTQFSASNGGWSAAGPRSYLQPSPDPWSSSASGPAAAGAVTWHMVLPAAAVSAQCPSGGSALRATVVSRDGHGDWGGRITALRLDCTTGIRVLGGAALTFGGLLPSAWWTATPVVSSPPARAAPPTRTVHRLAGPLLAKWGELGGAGGALGQPTTDETAVPGGRLANFAGSGGASIVWSAATGAHVVSGPVKAQWVHLGATSGLGLPVTDQVRVLDGTGASARFQRGSVYWSPLTGAHAVTGAIRSAWAVSGWEAGPLGLPVSDAYAVAGGVRSDFQHGSLVLTFATGVVHRIG